MHQTTIPFGEPELMRASEFQRYLEALDESSDRSAQASHSACAGSLTPSLLADIQRFEHTPGGTEAVEVLAACLRHAQSVMVHFEASGCVLPVTVYPRERLFHCPVPPAIHLMPRLDVLTVLRIEPALVCPPGDANTAMVSSPEHYHPLGPLLWALAMRGSRSELLPEIAGPACYRTVQGLDLRTLGVDPALHALLGHMGLNGLTLHDLTGPIGLGQREAARLLNALYLQSALIVSRTTMPPAPSAGWVARLRGRIKGE